MIGAEIGPLRSISSCPGYSKLGQSDEARLALELARTRRRGDSFEAMLFSSGSIALVGKHERKARTGDGGEATSRRAAIGSPGGSASQKLGRSRTPESR